MIESYSLITGASSGIGRALAYKLASDQHNLILVARRESKLLAIKKEIQAKYPELNIVVSPCDLTDSVKLEEVFTTLFDSYRVDHIFNNAGMGYFSSFKDLEFQKHRETIALNITSLTHLCHMATEHMLKHDFPAHIINIASMASKVSFSNFSVYCASKHYVRSLSESLAIELGHTNISVTCISPGGVNTEFLGKAGQKLARGGEIFLMSPSKLAEKILDAVKRKKIHYVPGMMNYLALCLLKFLPTQLANRIASKAMSKTVDSD